MAIRMANNMFIYDDNFLSEKEIKEVEDMFLDTKNNWRYSQSTVNMDQVEAFGLSSLAKTAEYGTADSAVFSEYFTMEPEPEGSNFKIFDNVLKKFAEKNKIKYSQILRVKFNMTPSSSFNVTTFPHIDSRNPHYIFLYYVNDSDGETIIYNEKFDGKEIESLSVMKRIKPKRGAALFVDGRHFHSIAIPSHGSLRKVMNANLFSLNMNQTN
jgi:hypothetical protein